MNAERPEEAVDEAPADAQSPDTDEQVDTEDQADEPAADEVVDPEAALAAAEKKASEHWDRYLRAAAELENVRKRAERELEKAHKFALERFGKELLAVRDTLEMGLAAAESATVESILEGKNATLKLLSSTMQQFGIEQVDPVGEPFDPELHEAISVQASDNVEPGSVVTVVQKGYTLNGRLLRPAMVIVAAD